jgi:hypothetical protein
MRDPLNKLAEGQKKQMVRPRPGMMFRGMLKVVLIAIAASQILTTAFTLLAHQIDPALSPEIISVVSMWLQADARRAFGFAKEKGFVAAARDGQPGPRIAADCPRRWLVVLHIELNPAAAA